MNDTGHFLISMTKSVIRILSAIFTIHSGEIIWLAGGFLIAEFLGIIEEVVDKR